MSRHRIAHKVKWVNNSHRSLLSNRGLPATKADTSQPTSAHHPHMGVRQRQPRETQRQRPTQGQYKRPTKWASYSRASHTAQKSQPLTQRLKQSERPKQGSKEDVTSKEPRRNSGPNPLLGKQNPCRSRCKCNTQDTHRRLKRGCSTAKIPKADPTIARTRS